MTKEIEDLIRKSKDAFIARNLIEEKRNSSRTQLDVLKRERSSLTSELECLNHSSIPVPIEIKSVKLERAGIDGALLKLKSNLEKIDLVIDKGGKKRLPALKKRGNLVAECDELQMTVQSHHEILKELVRKEEILIGKTLPEETTILSRPKDHNLIKMARGMSEKNIHSKLKALNSTLAKLQERGIDARLLENIKELSEKMEFFGRRLSSCQSEITRVQMLSDEIEMRKSQKMEFTYNQIKKNFKDILAVLAPSCSGGLRFVYPSSQNALAEDPIGLTFKVRFDSNTSELISDTNQLSGGQKALIAIAFILAVQRCDPVPFYVMDEIDAALDDDHRSRVSSLMSEQNDVQFICTTFRKEFILRADHFVGVKYSGQASRVYTISGMEQAIQFVDETREENSDCT